MKRFDRAKKIDGLCDERGCDERQRKKHYDQYVKFHWDPHPPAAFLAWWNPTGTDKISGAHIGGHSDAMHIEARKNPDGSWTRRVYNTITSETAWNVQRYRDEFYAWQEAGSPERPEKAHIAATLERQKQFFKDPDFRELFGLFGSGASPEVTMPLVEKLNKKFPGYDPM